SHRYDQIASITLNYVRVSDHLLSTLNRRGTCALALRPALPFGAAPLRGRACVDAAADERSTTPRGRYERALFGSANYSTTNSTNWQLLRGARTIIESSASWAIERAESCGILRRICPLCRRQRFRQ